MSDHYRIGLAAKEFGMEYSPRPDIDQANNTFSPGEKALACSDAQDIRLSDDWLDDNTAKREETDDGPLWHIGGAIDLQEITAQWVSLVKRYFSQHDNLTQVHARGHFAGMSEGNILSLANQLADNAEKYPIHQPPS